VKAFAGSLRYESKYKRHFDQFRQQQLKFTARDYHSVHELIESPPASEAMICGSDQVWHYQHIPITWFMKRFTDAYMLNFGKDDCIRIAYAPSLGVTKIKHEERAFVSKKLSRFKCIGTREKVSIPMVSAICPPRIPVQWVPDPTLLLSTDDYDQLLKGCELPVPEYFIYSLGNKSVLTGKKVAAVLAAEHKVYSHTSCQYENDYTANIAPRIEEWLYLMKNSSTIITNSFHGIMFAILFHSEFYYFPLVAEVKGADTRITSVLELLEIKGRALSDTQDILRIVREPQPKIDWQAVTEKLDAFRETGHRFLSDALDNTSSRSPLGTQAN